jgi:predicted dehydrogenase
MTKHTAAFARVVMMAVLSAGAIVARPQAGQGPPPAPWAERELRAGIIGTDTSHVPQFTAILHAHPEWRVRVVAAFKGGSPDLPLSASRVEGFARTIREAHGVEFVDSIDALLARVDVVLLTSVDGRPHLAQVAPVFAAGKRVFIDKPLAASLDDVRRIAELSRQTGTPFFSASSVRFHPDLRRMRESAGVGTVRRVQANYVLNTIPFHPDLYYYGIHGVEALYEVMGRGCVSLSRTITPEADVTSCTWADGRVGVYRGTPRAEPGRPLVTVTGDGGDATTTGTAASEPIVGAIAEFFHTGRSPVDVAETIEVFEFMTAAELSKMRNGAAVPLAELRPR